MWETWVWSLGWEDPLKKGKAAHSRILAWRTPWIVRSRGRKESDVTEQLSLHFTLEDRYGYNKVYDSICPCLSQGHLTRLDVTLGFHECGCECCIVCMCVCVSVPTCVVGSCSEKGWRHSSWSEWCRGRNMEHTLKEQLGPKEQDMTEHRWGSTQGPAWLQGGVCGGAGGNAAGEGGQEAGGGGVEGGAVPGTQKGGQWLQTFIKTLCP